MSDVVIQVENLGKIYRIGRAQRRHDTLRDFVADCGLRIANLARRNPTSEAHNPNADDRIWALKGVSFEVKQGEVVGIIGRNGAGKSTLLKILSRITEPTEGRARVKGRVRSLLEVGTGFHPELTGRENIYLSGAILGMKKAEIDRKFDEIVDFSGVEKFLDTPVKRYSSGMQVRLGFAVAAHLEPEVLLVDEVLAVGDAEFQKKCLGKMEGVAKEGRTVLFVSHQMNAVRTLCRTCMLLKDGVLSLRGEPEPVIARYLGSDSSNHQWVASGDHSRLANPYFTPTRMTIVDRQLQPITRDIRADEEFGVLIEGIAEKLDSALTVGFAVYRVSGELLFWALHTDAKQDMWPIISKGRNSLIGWVPAHFLNEGDYSVELIISLHFISWISQPGVNAPTIRVSIRGGLSESPYWIMARPGLTSPIISFEVLENQR